MSMIQRNTSQYWVDNHFLFDFKEYMYDEASRASLATNHSFDEYLILSNGVAGSTTAIFQSQVRQLWIHRNSTQANSSVTAVSYGGATNALGDVTMAGFPASVVAIMISYPIIEAGLLDMFQSLLPSNSSFAEELNEASAAYTDTLPIPPVYAHSFPRMPVSNYYVSFMQPEALPLQYIKVAPDAHIPRVYTQVALGESTSDLGDLYGQASTMFPSYVPQPEAAGSGDDDDDYYDDDVPLDETSGGGTTRIQLLSSPPPPRPPFDVLALLRSVATTAAFSPCLLLSAALL